MATFQIPKFDFAKYINLLATARSRRLQIIPEINPTGDLTVKTIASADLTSDHGFIIKIVDVTYVNTIQGRFLLPQPQ